MAKIIVSATSANLGAGFDSLGMALTMNNQVEFEQTGSGLVITVEGEGRGRVPVDERNLVYKAIVWGMERTGRPVPPLRLHLTNGIPMTRGLGSSSACIVAGLCIANELSGGEISQADMIDLAGRIEGHPDNILPAIVGGMTVGAIDAGHVYYVRLDPPEGLGVCVFIPPFSLQTKKARQVLPQTVPRADAVFNVSRAALMVGAMATGDLSLLGEATKDKLHEPYRKPLVPGYARVQEAAFSCGAQSCCLSGAGPTILSFIEGDGQEFAQRMRGMVPDWRVELLAPCREGVCVIK